MLNKNRRDSARSFAGCAQPNNSIARPVRKLTLGTSGLRRALASMPPYFNG
jgi:hypothetical protein